MASSVYPSRRTALRAALVLTALLVRCGSDAPTNPCATVTGTPWTPNVPTVGASNHVSGITVTKSTQTASARVRGLAEGVPVANEAVFTIDMSADLGSYGSLQLMAQADGYPTGLSGSAFAVLTSLHDGVNELVNLPRAGTGGDCVQSGYFTCAGASCSANSACKPSWPSAFTTRANWEQYQLPNVSAVNSPSINTFPTCVGNGGTQGSATEPACAFTGVPFFVSTDHLRTGTYTARYALIADSYATISGNVTANVKLTVVKKTSAVATMGAVDLNVMIVGKNNIQASRTAKGQQNLNTLISRVATMLAGSGAGPKIGAVNAVEACSINYAPKISQLATLFASSGSLAPASSDGKAINVYLVETISDDNTSSAFTILGYDGAIGGPAANGSASSGLAVSTFNGLSTLNPNCGGTGICAESTIDAGFNDLTEAVAHEIGHYLGLNHLSENDGTQHDVVLDTPFCTAKSGGALQVLTINSCRVTDTSVYTPTAKKCSQTCTSYNAGSGIYCPSALECEFNYLMWWTTKNFTAGPATGDANLISTESLARVQRGPVIQ